MMQIWGFWESSACKGCDCLLETTQHLFCCPHPKMRQQYTDSLNGFEQWLTAMDTDPDIQECLMRTLAMPLEEAAFTANIDDTDEDLMAAALAQDHIGVHNFFLGRISLDWRLIQDRYYREIGSRRTAKRWVSGLVKHLLEFSHSLWICRNTEIVHAKDAQGLPVAEGQALNAEIQQQFQEGTTTLLLQDRYLLERYTVDQVLQKHAASKRQWVESIQLARQLFLNTREDEEAQMRNAMQEFLNP